MVGLIGFLGTGIGLIVFGRLRIRTRLPVSGTLFILSGATVIAGFVVMRIPGLSPVQGFVLSLAKLTRDKKQVEPE